MPEVQRPIPGPILGDTPVPRPPKAPVRRLPTAPVRGLPKAPVRRLPKAAVRPQAPGVPGHLRPRPASGGRRFPMLRFQRCRILAFRILAFRILAPGTQAWWVATPLVQTVLAEAATRARQAQFPAGRRYRGTGGCEKTHENCRGVDVV